MGNRRDVETRKEAVEHGLDHASLTATTIEGIFVTQRRFKLLDARYYNETGLTVDPTNYFDIQVQTSADVLMANWSTETGQEGTIAAGSWVQLALTPTVANLVVPAGTEIEVEFLEGGTATLPGGRLVVIGEYF